MGLRVPPRSNQTWRGSARTAPSTTGASCAAPIRTSCSSVGYQKHVVAESVGVLDDPSGPDRDAADPFPALFALRPGPAPDLESQRRLRHDQFPKPTVRHEGDRVRGSFVLLKVALRVSAASRKASRRSSLWSGSAVGFCTWAYPLRERRDATPLTTSLISVSVQLLTVLPVPPKQKLGGVLLLRRVVDCPSEHIKHTAIHVPAVDRAEAVVEEERASTFQAGNTRDAEFPQDDTVARAHSGNFLKGVLGGH